MKDALDAKYENLDVATRIAFAFESKCDGSRSFATLYRYEARLLRAGAKAEERLDKLLELRRQLAEETKNCTIESDPTGQDEPNVDH